MDTYTITCTSPSDRAETRTGTLNALRGWLIDEAHRWDWNLEGLQDTADALNDGEPLPDATAAEVAQIASQVWDEHPNHIAVTPA